MLISYLNYGFKPKSIFFTSSIVKSHFEMYDLKIFYLW